MSGYSNSVDRFFLIDSKRRGIDLDSTKDRVTMIDHLVRCELVEVDAADLETRKTAIRDAVEHALRHLDDDEPWDDGDDDEADEGPCSHEYNGDTCDLWGHRPGFGDCVIAEIIGSLLALIAEMVTCRPYMRPWGERLPSRSTNV